MTLPNFLIIGAGRSGTTSLHRYLGQHPEIYMSPIKETNFFSYEEGVPGRLGKATLTDEFPARTVAAYRRLFNGARDERAIGEASPRYLSSTRTPERIHRAIPDAKLIALLRDPVERAYSSYLLNLNSHREHRTFAQAVADERRQAVDVASEEWQGRWPAYLLHGFYHRHLSAYLKRFDRHQLGIYLYDDLECEAQALMKNVFSFLGVDSAFVPDLSARYNVSALPRSGWLRHLVRPRASLSAVKRRIPDSLRRPAYRYAMRFFYDAALKVRAKSQAQPKEPLAPALRGELTDLYRSDILALQTLVGRDLSSWLE